MLEGVAEAVRGCTRCGLCETRTNAVPGLGGGRSGVMFVGEAPGRSEDLRGRPFVGRAGRILTEALRAAGVSRDDVYITNTVKCRPPNNRVPRKSERQACRAHLEEEIRLLRPLVVCVMGNTAFGSLLGGSGITERRRELVRRDGVLYYPTVHPAAAMYKPALAGVLEGDIRHLFGIVRRIKEGEQVDATEHTS